MWKTTLAAGAFLCGITVAIGFGGKNEADRVLRPASMRVAAGGPSRATALELEETVTPAAPDPERIEAGTSRDEPAQETLIVDTSQLVFNGLEFSNELQLGNKVVFYNLREATGWETNPIVQPDGSHRSEWPNGELLEQGSYLNSRRVGSWIHGHESGHVAAKGRYVAGEKDGRWTTWHSHGKKSSEGSYVYGKLDGPWREWDGYGKLRSANHYVNNLLDGPSRTWHADGSPSGEGEYVLGDAHGHWQTWHPGGEPASSGMYHYGQRIGYWQFWNAAGDIDEALTGQYENGFKIGQDT